MQTYGEQLGSPAVRAPCTDTGHEAELPVHTSSTSQAPLRVFDLYAQGQTEAQRSRVSWVDAVVTETMSSNLGPEGWQRLGLAGLDLSILDPAARLAPGVQFRSEWLEVGPTGSLKSSSSSPSSAHCSSR